MRVTQRLPRPALSPLLAGAAAVWCAVEAVVRASRSGFLVACCLVSALLAALLCLLAWRVARARAAALCAAVGLVCGMVAAGAFVARVTAAGEALAAAPLGECAAVVATDPRQTSSGYWRFEADVSAPGGASGRVWVDYRGDGGDALPGLGTRVALAGSWRTLDLSQDFDASLWARGVCARATARSVEEVGRQGGPLGAVRSFRARLLAVLDPASSPARALVAGVVCGNQGAVSAFDVGDDFSNLGLSHLVAVSGSHLAVVSGIAGTLVGRLRLRPGWRCAILGAFLGVYVLFTGVQVSAVRAWVMAVLGLTSVVVGRRAHAVSAVGAAAAAMMLVDPGCASNLGFQLSVLSVAGLALYARLVGAWVARALPARAPDALGEGVGVTLVSQAATAPVALPTFGVLPLLAPVANVVVAPAVSLLLVLGIVCLPLAALLPQAAGVLLAPCDLLGGAVCALSALLAAVPYCALPVEVSAAPLLAATLAVAAAVYVRWPLPGSARPGLLLAVGAGTLLAYVLAWGPFAPTRVVVLDVGQGDAILVQSGAHALLVDTGPDDAVVYALAANHVRRLDAVVLTHTDLDHSGGLDDLVGKVAVGELVVAAGVAGHLADKDGLAEAADALVGEHVEEVNAGGELACGSLALDVLWPAGEVAGNQNTDSLVLAVRDADEGDAWALLTGDAEADVLESLLAAGELGEVDLLKVGHHGSAASTTPAVAAALAPLVAVASAGENNSYGHPTEACVEALEGAGAQVHVTFRCGDVDVRPSDEGVVVRCEHHGDG
jgi:competence protein ComEC